MDGIQVAMANGADAVDEKISERERKEEGPSSFPRSEAEHQRRAGQNKLTQLLPGLGGYEV